MKKEVLKKNIDCLNLDNVIIQKLNSNSIQTVEQLWQLKRQDLKVLNFKTCEINQIIIRLQLVGLDLNHKKY